MDRQKNYPASSDQEVSGSYSRLQDSSPTRSGQRQASAQAVPSPRLQQLQGSTARGQPAQAIHRRMVSPSSAAAARVINHPQVGFRGGITASQRDRQPKPKLKPKHIIGGQQGRTTIGKERFVPLTVGEESETDNVETSLERQMLSQGPGLFEDIETMRARGRITIFCLAESTNLIILEQKLRACDDSEAKMEKYPEVIYCQYQRISAGGSDGDVFFFDYGVIACWGLEEDEEAQVQRFCNSCLVDPLDDEMVEVDELSYQYTSSERPHIQNDIVTLNRRFASIHEVKMAICHALAQSTKLALFEEQVQTLVEDTRELPEKLAEEGEIHMDRKEINKLIGQVFLQKAAVNLLSTVLDTPEYFWSAPDILQALYKRVCDYLEMDDRVELLNRRFSVLQEMLDMLRDQTNNAHGQRLEWIVIWLIVVEVVIGLFECMSILGLVGPKSP